MTFSKFLENVSTEFSDKEKEFFASIIIHAKFFENFVEEKS